VFVETDVPIGASVVTPSGLPAGVELAGLPVADEWELLLPPPPHAARKIHRVNDVVQIDFFILFDWAIAMRPASSWVVA
jgi:hypothetical protein